MKGALKKLIVLVSICAFVGILALVDLGIKKSYKIEFVSVERLEAEGQSYEDVPLDCGIADGTTVVRFVVKVTRNGKPVEGHTLYVKTNRNVLSRSTTDENGEIVIDYKCYKATRASQVSDIVLTVRDEDNSLFVFNPAEERTTLKMHWVGQEFDSSMTTNDIFYDIHKKGGEE